MLDVFRTVEPVTPNLQTYGHQIRQLLILACNEVETQTKGILKANNCPGAGKNMNIKDDYFKLAKPMKLSAWKVRLASYPDYPELVPFAAWSGPDYQPLPWYRAYNDTKHDREGAFAKGIIGEHDRCDGWRPGSRYRSVWAVEFEAIQCFGGTRIRPRPDLCSGGSSTGQTQRLRTWTVHSSLHIERRSLNDIFGGSS